MLEIFILDFDWFTNKAARLAEYDRIYEKAMEAELIKNLTSHQLNANNSRWYYQQLEFNYILQAELLDNYSNFWILYIWIKLHFKDIVTYIFMYNFIKTYTSKDLNKPIIYDLKKNKLKKITWVDIWEINIQDLGLESYKNSSWNLYYKYKLSILNTWHILEDRIIILLSIIIFLL
jgi:hypothetical protein